MSGLVILPEEGKTVQFGGTGAIFYYRGGQTVQVGERFFQAPVGTLIVKPRASSVVSGMQDRHPRASVLPSDMVENSLCPCKRV